MSISDVVSMSTGISRTIDQRVFSQSPVYHAGLSQQAATVVPKEHDCTQQGWTQRLKELCSPAVQSCHYRGANESNTSSRTLGRTRTARRLLPNDITTTNVVVVGRCLGSNVAKPAEVNFRSRIMILMSMALSTATGLA